ncbi:MAG: NAD(P)H-hydrate dehydratase [Candidatus Baltobacteraceae bacterium]
MNRTYPLLRSKTLTSARLRGWPLPAHRSGDKNERGRILIVGGSQELPGPVTLCATAALRAGAGKLQIATSPAIAPQIGIAMPEALSVAFEKADPLMQHADAAVLGPGMDSDACATLLTRLLPLARGPVVLDAAALVCIGADPALVRGAGVGVVLTPHAGEMAALLQCERREVENGPVRALHAAVERFGAWIALKGERTWIAGPQSDLYCNTSGTAALATSGSGDTLAGIIGGLLARGTHPLHAIAWGVYVHAKAGERLKRETGAGFLARELPAQVPLIIRTIERG